MGRIRIFDTALDPLTFAFSMRRFFGPDFRFESPQPQQRGPQAMVGTGSGVVINEDGLGVGLSLSRQIMKLHGGTLSVESIPEERTAFSLVFNS